MLKSDIREYLREHVADDTIYTEATSIVDECFIIECCVWSASAGYSVKIRRKVNVVSNRNVQITRAMLLRKVINEIDKFTCRFLYDDESISGLDVLSNDGFNYEEF